MAHLFFLLIVAIWGASFLFMKKGALAFGPVSMGALRVLGGALVLGLAWRLRGGGWPFARRDLLPLVAVVAVGLVWPYCLQPYLVERNGSGFVGMSMAFVPLLTILASIPILGIYPTRLQAAGVAGGLAFVGVLMWDAWGRSDVRAGDFPILLTVPLAYAVTNTYIKRRLAGVPSLELSCATLALASLLLLPTAALLPQEREHFLSNLDAGHFALAAGCVAVLGVLGTGAATFMFYRLIRDKGPLFAAMVTYLIPSGAIVLGWLDAEPVTARQLVALAGILIMVALVQFGGTKAPAPDSSSVPA